MLAAKQEDMLMTAAAQTRTEGLVRAQLLGLCVSLMAADRVGVPVGGTLVFGRHWPLSALRAA